MNRRFSGFLLVFAVLVTGLVIHSATARRIAGRPVAGPIPGPPSVGDCLLDSRVSSWLYNPNPVYSSRRIEPCSGSRYGEVIAVIDDSRSPEQIAAANLGLTHPRGETPSEDPTFKSCNDALDPYLGLPSGSRGEGGDDGGDAVDDWSYAGSVIPAPAGPNDTQKAAGQHWVACLATSMDIDKQTGTADVTARTYAGSARGVYSKGRPPSAFALCVLRLILPDILEPVNCSRAHTVEVFGVTQTHSKNVTQTQLNTTCIKLAQRLTRMPDPTVGGQLNVTAAASYADHYGDEQVGLSTAEDQAGFAVCMAIAPKSHRLKGALLGLGSEPVPWA